MERTAKDFKERAEKEKMIGWHLRNCSICKSPIGYIFKEGSVYFDSSCNCSLIKTEPRLKSWEDIEAFYNMQSEAVKVGMDKDWGFKDNPDTWKVLEKLAKLGEIIEVGADLELKDEPNSYFTIKLGKGFKGDQDSLSEIQKIIATDLKDYPVIKKFRFEKDNLEIILKRKV